MDQEPLPYYSEPDGPPPAMPPAPPRRVPRVAIAVGLTALFGLGGAGLAFATGGGSSSGPSTSSSGSDSSASSLPAGPNVKIHRHAFRFAFGGPVIHAQYTVQDGSTYKTYATQVGRVTSVSAKSITVKSADGFTQTYTVQTSTIVDSQSAGIGAVATKDTVTVEALVSSSGQTATNIVDVTKIGDSRKGFGLPDKPEGGWIGYGPGGPPPGGARPSTAAAPPIPA